MDDLITLYESLIKMNPYSPFAILDELYSEYKESAKSYWKDESTINDYIDYVKRLKNIENNMPLHYICDTSEVFKDNRKFNLTVLFGDNPTFEQYSASDVLDYIVYVSRKRMIKNQDLRKNFDRYDLTNKCYEGSFYASSIAQSCGLESYIIKINPGFSKENILFGNTGVHYFCIVIYKDKPYLVDTTYKQFFKKSKCSLEKLGIPYHKPPFAGVFMMMDKFRAMVATTLLKYGWIELTEEVLKAYCDGFAMSFRNGLYYEQNGGYFETPYTAQDYIRFLKYEDSQLNHEDTQTLGYQKKPLKEPINFKK